MTLTMTVTESAAERLLAITAEHGITEEQGLRLFTRGGGCACSGPSFGMAIDNAESGDSVFTLSGIRFIVDDVSADSLEGASIDWVDDVMRSGFTIEAPNAQTGGGCGCGGH
ncbi:MAG: iron-sulfur cluster assembly accessory protein [Dehalococcoidia bacterium]|nr:iron-sulfur cluster assembly accessory protein [Dehalococcoidia bacterium]HRC62212.1 iron-sulfur cluster assembly accessory protein [Dehalococcoidia bacterium]